MNLNNSKIVHYKCPRCGIATVGFDRPLLGDLKTHEKFKGICSKCTTEEEKKELLEIQGNCFLRKIKENEE